MKHFEWPNELSVPVYFANRQWAVTAYGLECLTESYAIERARLTERLEGHRSISDWVIHVGTKPWCDPHELAEAFGEAIQRHKVKGRTLIDVAESLTMALKERSEDQRFSAFCEDIGGVRAAEDIKAASDLLYGEIRIPSVTVSAPSPAGE